MGKGRAAEGCRQKGSRAGSRARQGLIGGQHCGPQAPLPHAVPTLTTTATPSCPATKGGSTCSVPYRPPVWTVYLQPGAAVRGRFRGDVHCV